MRSKGILFLAIAVMIVMTLVSVVSASTLTVVSDSAAQWSADGSSWNSCYATWVFPGWPNITGATWIWRTSQTDPQWEYDNVPNQGNNETYWFFQKTFTLPTCIKVTNAILYANADNAESYGINGVIVGHDGKLNKDESDVLWNTTETANITSYVHGGSNVLNFRAVNFQRTGTYETNPAGLTFKAVITYTTMPDCTPPDTNVTYFTKHNEIIDPRNCGAIDMGKAYTNYQELVGHGISADTQSNLLWVRYRWDDRSAKTAYNTSGFKTEYWFTDWNDYPFTLGWHTLCGWARDVAGNEEVPENPEDCCDVCIDMGTPVMDSISDNTQDCSEDGKYWNQNSITWTWTAHDDDCADIWYYNVTLYENGNFDKSEIVYAPDHSKTFSGLDDGNTYYIEVFAVDKSWNQGSEMDSDEILIDMTEPEVTIDTDNLIWYAHDFTVYETDTDANPLTAKIRIVNDITEVLPYFEVGWNGEYTVSVSTQCTAQGAKCHVWKRAIDKACNSFDTEKVFKIDTQAPTTTKTVGDPEGPKHEYESGDWYVTDHTYYTLACDDNVPDGSGCNATYYRVNGGEWILYNNPFVLSLEDGPFTLEWYSIDNVENQEAINSETDFMDNTDPVTTKAVGDPKYPYGNDWYVTDHTTYTLTCTDKSGTYDGSGCFETYYSTDGVNWITYTGPFNLSLPDGPFTLRWYSIDNVGNVEGTHEEFDFMDNTAPTIIIEEPKDGEDEFGCGANIFTVKASITDDGSGVNGATAELFYPNDTSTGRTVSLTKAQGYWEGSINHWNLKADYGYYVKVTAWDNLANTDSEYKDIDLVYDVYFQWINDGDTFTVPKGQSGSTTFDIKLCHGGNATGMIMSKICGVVDLNPVLSYSTYAFDINQESYMDFFNHIFNWQSNVFLPLNISQDVIGVERTVTLTVTIPSDLQCSQSLDCKYMGYKWGAAYEGDNTPEDPSEDLFGIGWFGVKCNSDSITFEGDGIVPPECENGQEKCEGTTYFLCENSHWSNKGLVSGKCGYTQNQGGGGGGGGSSRSSASSSITCNEQWICQWGSCINNMQFGNCVDQNNCGTTNDKPALSRACTSETSSQEVQTNGNTGSSDKNLITGNVIGGSKALYGGLLMVCIIALAIVIAVVARRLASKKA